MKYWLILGVAIAAGPSARNAHVRMNMRDKLEQAGTEAVLDAHVATLSDDDFRH
jgi:hypothetical protein